MGREGSTAWAQSPLGLACNGCSPHHPSRWPTRMNWPCLPFDRSSQRTIRPTSRFSSNAIHISKRVISTHWEGGEDGGIKDEAHCSSHQFIDIFSPGHFSAISGRTSCAQKRYAANSPASQIMNRMGETLLKQVVIALFLLIC